MTSSPKGSLLFCAAAFLAAAVLVFDIVLVGEVRSVSDAQRREQAETREALERFAGDLREESENSRKDVARMSEKLEGLSRVLAGLSEDFRADRIERVVSENGGFSEGGGALQSATARGGTSATSDLAMSRSIEKGREAFEAQEYEKAAEIFSNVSRLQPENAEAERYEAASRFYANPSDSTTRSRAEEVFLAAIEETSDDGLALRALGFLSMEKGEWEAALDYFTRLDEFGQADGPALSAAAAAATWAGNTEKAALLSEKVTRKEYP